jgi:hypothetical protein
MTTAIYTIYCEHYRANVEERRSFIRRGRYLTVAGAQRLIRRGSIQEDPLPDAVVVRIERATFG